MPPVESAAKCRRSLAKTETSSCKISQIIPQSPDAVAQGEALLCV